jgi:hypothetical protein
MSTQDLFGLKTDDLETARGVFERTFGLTLEPRHGSYHGGDYYSRKLENGDEFTLQINNDNDGEEGSWAEEGYKDFGVLLYVFSPSDGDQYKNRLTCKQCGFVPLERSLTTPSRLLRRMRYVDGKEEVYFETQLSAV